METCYEVFSSHEERETPGKVKRKARKSTKNRNAIILFSLLKLSCFLNLNTSYKITRKIFKDRIMSDLSVTFPMDFVGASKSEGEPAIIYISSEENEDMEILSTCSVDDLYLSSKDETEEVRLLTKCIERQLVEPIPIPTSAACSPQKRPVTPRPNVPPFLTFGEKYFDLALGNGPVSRDSRVKANHSINLCSNLVPQVDTPLSPPEKDREPQYLYSTPSCSSPSIATSMETVTSHFDGMTLAESTSLHGCSDCIICEKPVQQIQEETQ